MMPVSGNFDSQYDGATQGSSLMGYLKSPGTLLQGYNQVPEMSQMTEGLSTSAAQLFSRDNLRSMSALTGTGEDVAFGCAAPRELIERVRFNIKYFYLNYMYLTALFFCVNLFFRPGAWIGIGLLAVAWIVMANNITDERMLKMASVGLSVVSCFVLYYLLSGAFWWTIYLSGGLIVSHALLRNIATLQMMQDPTMNFPPNAGFYQGPQIVGA